MGVVSMPAVQVLIQEVTSAEDLAAQPALHLPHSLHLTGLFVQVIAAGRQRHGCQKAIVPCCKLRNSL